MEAGDISFGLLAVIAAYHLFLRGIIWLASRWMSHADRAGDNPAP